MKDFLGNELAVGDEVVFDKGFDELGIGVVLKFNEEGFICVKVEGWEILESIDRHCKQLVKVIKG